MKNLPASSFSELSGNGTINRHLITSKIFFNDHYRGFQSFFNVFTQISPFSDTLGWNILVLNKPNLYLLIPLGAT